ncbi:MAG: hypothetical protein Q8N17_26255 [Burkholderiaceae bacterium]|nr:hypothetical protein [Burkholderiaceae bacterium]
MNQSELNARMRPWGDVEFRRFPVRVALFKRRGLNEAQAEALADRLALRDQEKDDRRVCLECEHLQNAGTCFAAQQGWMRSVSTHLAPVRDLLGRCTHFSAWKPA